MEEGGHKLRRRTRRPGCGRGQPAAGSGAPMAGSAVPRADPAASGSAGQIHPPLPSETPGTAGMRPAASTAADAHQSRLLCELCALLLTVLRASPEDGAVARPLLPRQVTPAGVASMLLGASMVLMLCGSVTFMLALVAWQLGCGPCDETRGDEGTRSTKHWPLLLPPFPSLSGSSSGGGVEWGWWVTGRWRWRCVRPVVA